VGLMSNSWVRAKGFARVHVRRNAAMPFVYAKNGRWRLNAILWLAIEC